MTRNAKELLHCLKDSYSLYNITCINFPPKNHEERSNVYLSELMEKQGEKHRKKEKKHANRMKRVPLLAKATIAGV